MLTSSLLDLVIYVEVISFMSRLFYAKIGSAIFDEALVIC